MKILIGYDGSECSNAAINDLRRAGLPAVAEALVLTTARGPRPVEAAGAVAVGGARVFGENSDDEVFTSHFLQEAREFADQAADRLRTEFPLWHVTPEAWIDAAGPAIVRQATAWGADLIVVGSHGRVGLSRLVLGSVSRYVLDHARCSVRISRCAGRGQPTNHVLVGVDGSSCADAAVQAVAARNWPQGAEARVVGVMDDRSLLACPFTVTPEAVPLALADQWRSELTATTCVAAGRLNESGLLSKAEVLEGSACKVLLDEAEQWGADCVFVGARGLYGLERLLLGNVSTAIATRAHCSVEVVRSNSN